MKLWRKKTGIFLFLSCYLLWLTGLLLFHLFGFASNRLAYAQGRFETQEVKVQDFELVNLIETEQGLLSITEDPQLILLDRTRKVDTIELSIEYSRPPRVVTVFWGKANQDHSVRRMAYPDVANDTHMSFWLSPFGVQNLRIDPGTVVGNEMIIQKIILNKPRSFFDFFRFSTMEWVLLLTIPGGVASGLWLVKIILAKWQETGKGGAKE